tara:strand:+ start:201 stop:428 length:228 start_codon:yes stop_codon:yes gene_type:complete
MTIFRSNSLNENLNNEIDLKSKLNQITSFNDFEKLELSGQQELLSFGEYSQKENSTKNNRQKTISYFYKKLLSKL